VELASAEAVHEAAQIRIGRMQRGTQVGEQGRPPAWRVGAVEHGDIRDAAELGTQPADGQGPERPHFQQADALSLST
jgi:hypothetical protein